METRIEPGIQAGPWKLGTSRSDTIKLLDSKSIQYEERNPGGFDFIYSEHLVFNFSDKGLLKQVCVVGEANEMEFRGVKIGDQVQKLGELGFTVSADYYEGLLVLRDTPGIFFNFSGDDDHYAGAGEVELEGDEEELIQLFDPPFILSSPIDRICVCEPFESDGLLDLNA